MLLYNYILKRKLNIMRNYKKELEEDLKYGRQNNFKVVLIEADIEKRI